MFIDKAPGLELFLDYVNRLALGFVISPRKHLAQQSDTYKLHSDHDQQNCEQQRRSISQFAPEHDLLEHQHSCPQTAESAQHESDESEDLNRRGRVTGKKLDRDQIEQGADDSPQAVFGGAGLARTK